MVNPTSTRKLCFEILKVRKEELLSLVADADNYYKPYKQSKKRKDGTVKDRDIEPSIEYLKKVQRKIDKHILKPAMATLPSGVMGGRPHMSVVDNANIHASSPALMKYDVKDFFPSIKYHHVYYIFRYRLNICEESARFIAGLVRRARKYYLGVSIISQQANDFLSSDYGRAIASQSALRILMRQDTTTIKNVVSQFALSEYESNFLLTCDKGDALIIADKNHVAVKVVASEKEHPLITTNPAELYL